MRHKPKTFLRTKLPFRPRQNSRVARKWPEIHEIQEYLSRLRAYEVGVEGEASSRMVNGFFGVMCKRYLIYNRGMKDYQDFMTIKN